ncbi:MAG: UDP-N-acetylglucosamine 1-carboxyvinyltransferase [Deltaproteobacteria bacterium]|nr:UDP-N-acetylglucosamine 1-carboxyvinyltransferase [Deltaproteobacteria bacterium]
MDKIIIEGGRRLTGEVVISGAKNAALPCLAAAILAPGICRFHNIPNLRDIVTTKKLLANLGLTFEGDSSLQVDASNLADHVAPYELVKTMRASVLVLGPLVARLGKAKVSLPGGCAIGARPVNMHLKALEDLGVSIKLEHGYIYADAPDGLKGATIVFDQPTVTGTENILMAAVMAKGQTIMKNVAREPEVSELAGLLNQMGANIVGAGGPELVIEGVEGLYPVEHTIMSDRIEAGTYMVAAALTGGEVTIKRCPAEYLGAFIEKLVKSGTEVITLGDATLVRRTGPIKSVDIKTTPYPGFPTDMQAQFMVLMSLANGLSVLSETIFENRFMHVSELRRMGADIVVEGRNAIVRGQKGLSGAPVMATDLRASASLVLAGLVATGTTEISRVYHLDRGYEHIEKKLAALGAQISRIQE